jgi:hypothetical protein
MLAHIDPSTAPILADQARLERAKRKVAALKGFYIHFAVFVLALAGLAIVNAFTGRPWWVLWVLFGWGIGIVAHAIAVMGRTSKAIADWEERKLQQFMRDGR